MIEFQRRVRAVPAEHLQGWEVARALVKMGESDFALLGVFVAVRGNEQQIAELPAGTVGAFRPGPALDDKIGEDAAQHDNRQALLLKVDPEDAPRLPAGERAELFDFLELRGVFSVEAEFVGTVIVGDVLDAVAADGPAEFVAQVGDALVEAFDLAELVGMHGKLAI